MRAVPLILALSLTGCLGIPYSTESVEFNSGSNPFSEVDVSTDSNGIIIGISDKERNLDKLKVKEITLTMANGKTIRLVIKEQRPTWSNNEPPYDRGYVCILQPPDSHFTLPIALHLKLIAEYESKRLTFDGEFTSQTHYHWASPWEIGR
jgi:hypothetical protein